MIPMDLKFWYIPFNLQDPIYRERLPKASPSAFSAHAAICEHQSTVHFVSAEYVGGILEFMADAFFKEYHGSIYKAGGRKSSSITAFDN